MFFADLRYSVRSLVKRPGFAVVVVMTLAVGIGINVAIYSVFEKALVRPLPVHDPRSLVNLAAPGPKPGQTSCNVAGDCTEIFSYPMFRDLERVQEPFVDIAAHRILESNLAFDGKAQAARRTAEPRRPPQLLDIPLRAAETGVSAEQTALLLGRGASALLFGVTATDWAVLSGAVAVLAVVVFGASYWPALRAARVNPMVALRSE